MEPLGYAQLLLRKWWLIVGMAAAAAALVYVISPARIVDEYTATHVVLVEGDNDAGSEANPEVVALWAKESAVLARAAQAIGPAVDPQALGRDIVVDADRGVGTVSVTATDTNAARAALKATAVADATVAFLVEREQLRRQEEQADLEAQETLLRERIAALDASIANNPADIETQTAERDAFIRQLGPVLEAQDADVSVVRFTSLVEPERGTREDRVLGTRTRAQRMAVAALVGLVLGFGLAILLDRSDTRVRTRRAAEEHFGLPVIAEIVRFPFWSRRRGRRLTVSAQPDTAVAESYRTLRSALMLLDHGGARSRRAAEPGAEAVPTTSDVIMITSAGRGDGKTTTASNLAAAYGESGRSVLMVSFDLRRARRRRPSRRHHAGVSEYLAAASPEPLASLVFDTGVPNVRAIDVGKERPPGGQLEAERRLLDEARALADVVIIDTAPLLASSINRELATMVDSVVAICRVGRTTVAEAERCGDLLAQLGAPAIGVVLVGVTAPEGSQYFSHFSVRRAHLTPSDEPAPDQPTNLDDPGLAHPNGDRPAETQPTPASSGDAPRVDG